VWRWRESLEPKGQANKVEEMQTAEINCQVCLGNAEINWTTNFVAQQIGNKFGWKQCALRTLAKINGQVVNRKKPQKRLPKNKAFSFCAFLREESKRPRDKAEKESHYHALQPGNQGLKG